MEITGETIFNCIKARLREQHEFVSDSNIVRYLSHLNHTQTLELLTIGDVAEWRYDRSNHEQTSNI